MWKNPGLIENTYCRFIAATLWENDFQSKPFPPATDPWKDAHEILFDLYEALRKENSVENAKRTIRKRIQQIADEICQEKKWGLVPDLYHVVQTLGTDTTEIRLAFGTCITLLVHYLVGTEKKILIGARHGQPTWVLWEPPQSMDSKPTVAMSLGPDIEYIGSEDLDLLDRCGTWVGISANTLTSLPVVRDCWRRVEDLLEHAYYNQQYVPHPAGSFVRLQGIPGLDSVVIKVKRGLRDRNFIDIIGLFSLGWEKNVVIIDGSMAMQKRDDLQKQLSSQYSNLLTWLTALIYHDLVTAKEKEVLGPRSVSEAVASAGLQKPEHIPELQWTYIPRTHKKTTQEVRRPASVRRCMSAHRVHGHKRRANMSDQQRDLIRDFEHETGLEVLRWIPEGYTFVRPYVVPKEGSESIGDLPLFIRTRIQSELQRLLAE